jgi:Transposase domain (DUF772)
VPGVETAPLFPPGLFILKHMHNLSDEVLCGRWLENPYYQFFCGELSFCHKLPVQTSQAVATASHRRRHIACTIGMARACIDLMTGSNGAERA